MKKMLCMLLCLTLLLGCASASGLGGLAGGGLAGLTGAVSPMPLPDPAEVLGVSGRLIQENYQFSPDFLCDAYFYTDVNGQVFISAYNSVVQELGYTVTEGTVDGTTAYRLEQAQTGLYALLVPDFQGGVLLLVEAGLSFGSTADSGSAGTQPAPAPQPEMPESDYLTFTYNGDAFSLGLSNVVPHEVGDGEIILNFFGNDETIDYISIYLPIDAEAGQDFVTTQEQGTQGLKFYVSGQTPFNSTHGGGSFYVWNSSNDDGSMDSASGDYFHLTILSVTRDSDAIRISGSFDGQFYQGREVFQNGEFFAIVPLS